MRRRWTWLAVGLVGAAWVAGVGVLAARWLDVAVLFTTPHPEEAARERAAALWLSGGFTTGAIVMTAVAWLGRVRWLAIASAVLAAMGAVGLVAGLF